jgi:hypothetical protein
MSIKLNMENLIESKALFTKEQYEKKVNNITDGNGECVKFTSMKEWGGTASLSRVLLRMGSSWFRGEVILAPY